MDSIYINKEDAVALAERILRKTNLNQGDVSHIVNHLITAECRGYPSHGLIRLPAIYEHFREQSLNLAPIKITDDLPGFLAIDGQGHQGISTVEESLAIALQKLKSSGALVIGIYNFVGTTGSLGIYSETLANANIASIIFCHSESAVAPIGSCDAILGTNPISMGIPAEPFNIVSDIATSAWSYGSLKTAMQENQIIPEGIVQTESGLPSHDPNDADNGSQLPMAGHKGYALGIGIELFCGALLGGKLGHAAKPGSDALIAVLIRADVKRPLSDVFGDISKLISEIKNSRKTPSTSEIRIPGESSSQKTKTCSGFSILQSTLGKLQEMAH